MICGDVETTKFRCHRCGRKFVDRSGFGEIHYFWQGSHPCAGTPCRGGITCGRGPYAKERRDGRRFGMNRTAPGGEVFCLGGCFCRRAKAAARHRGHECLWETLQDTGGGRYQFETMSAQSRHITSHDTAKDHDAVNLLRTVVKISGRPPIPLSDKLRGFRIGRRNVKDLPAILHAALCQVSSQQEACPQRRA